MNQDRGLELLAAIGAQIRERAELDRRRRLEARIQECSGDPERPIEISARTGQVTAIADVVAAALPVPRPRSSVELLDELETKLFRFLAVSAPSTWRHIRPRLVADLRAVRRELRSIDRSH